MQAIQKTHPIIAEIKAQQNSAVKAFGTAEEAAAAFQEIAEFYGKTASQHKGKPSHFCIRASLDNPSANAWRSGLKATVGTVELRTHHRTRNGEVHWITYTKYTGSAEFMLDLADKFGIDLT